MTDLLDRMKVWLEKNPYEIYGDYNDSLTVEQAQMLLQGDIDSFHDSINEWFDDFYHYIDFSEIQDEFIKEFAEDMGVDPDADFNDLDFVYQEVFDCHKRVNNSDFLDTCLRQTNYNVVAIPVKQSGNQIQFPHHNNEDSANRYHNKYLKDNLGVENGWDAETYYFYDVLKVCGRVDWQHIYKNGPPSHITVSKENKPNCLTHNDWNGSGGTGYVDITKSKKFRASFIIDNDKSYGVDSVFGFSDSFWRKELDYEIQKDWDKVKPVSVYSEPESTLMLMK